MSGWQPQQYDPAEHQRQMQGGQQPWPPQQQYPPQPPGYGQQSYPQQSPRRKRHPGRKIFGIAAGVIAAIIVIAIAANSSGHTVATTGTAAARGGAPKTAGIGSAITLAGNGSGEQVSVTVVKVIGKATPADEFSGAPAGDRLYAVQFRLRDTGPAAYSDAPDNSATVVDSAGQSYQSAIDGAAGCQSFGGTENIAPGSSGLGCIVFEVPKKAEIVSVQFTLDSGMGPQTGQWNVKG